jgi:hypothetical protein
MRPLICWPCRHVHALCVPYLYPPTACVRCVTESADMYIAFVLQLAPPKLGMHCSPSPTICASFIVTLLITISRFMQFMYVMGLHKAPAGQEKRRRATKKTATGRKRKYSTVALEVRRPYLLLLSCTISCDVTTPYGYGVPASVTAHRIVVGYALCVRHLNVRRHVSRDITATLWRPLTCCLTAGPSTSGSRRGW